MKRFHLYFPWICFLPSLYSIIFRLLLLFSFIHTTQQYRTYKFIHVRFIFLWKNFHIFAIEKYNKISKKFKAELKLFEKRFGTQVNIVRIRQKCIQLMPWQIWQCEWNNIHIYGFSCTYIYLLTIKIVVAHIGIIHTAHTHSHNIFLWILISLCNNTPQYCHFELR